MVGAMEKTGWGEGREHGKAMRDAGGVGGLKKREQKIEEAKIIPIARL